jgi:hypothetical protein
MNFCIGRNPKKILKNSIYNKDCYREKYFKALTLCVIGLLRRKQLAMTEKAEAFSCLQWLKGENYRSIYCVINGVGAGMTKRDKKMFTNKLQHSPQYVK